jgi:hypothetical protein
VVEDVDPDMQVWPVTAPTQALKVNGPVADVPVEIATPVIPVVVEGVQLTLTVRDWAAIRLAERTASIKRCFMLSPF